MPNTRKKPACRPRKQPVTLREVEELFSTVGQIVGEVVPQAIVIAQPQVPRVRRALQIAKRILRKLRRR